MKIYFNKDCSKCQEAFELIKSKGRSVEIVDYLNNSPSVETLKGIVMVLGITPFELVRQKEPLFIENYEGKEFSDEEWLKILSDNPILIERPIIIDGNRAVIGRPPIRVFELLKPKSK